MEFLRESYLDSISKFWAVWLMRKIISLQEWFTKLLTLTNQGKWLTNQSTHWFLCCLSLPVKCQPCHVNWGLKREINTRLVGARERLLWMVRRGVSPPILSQRGQPVPRRRHRWKEERKEEEEQVRSGRWWTRPAEQKEKQTEENRKERGHGITDQEQAGIVKETEERRDLGNSDK